LDRKLKLGYDKGEASVIRHILQVQVEEDDIDQKKEKYLSYLLPCAKQDDR
jgi:hypothetical protein